MTVPVLTLSALLCLLAAPVNVYAYLDPGTGSYFLQILAGVLLGGLYTVKIFWKRIKAFFHPPHESKTECEE
jgi:hypothetical protein